MGNNATRLMGVTDQHVSSSNQIPSFAQTSNNIPPFQTMPASVSRISVGPVVQLENYVDYKPKASDLDLKAKDD